MTGARSTIQGELVPFEHCPAMDGYHCQTNSLAKMFLFHGHPVSEDMLLGLGAGMGFLYWKMKFGSSSYVFVGGRCNTKGFFKDLGKRAGVRTQLVTTSSAKKAEAELLGILTEKKPAMLFGDMGLLPWFEFPADYHFGGHTFVACGYDGKDTVLASDMDAKASRLKKGLYHSISLGQLGKARGSPFKPFPPKNARLDLDFSRFRRPSAHDLRAAIKQTVQAQLHPPIKNVGVKGIRLAAHEILRWPRMFDDHELRMNLFSLYVFIEIGGTGGGCFRIMYSRFLDEATALIGDKRLEDSAKRIHRAGEIFSRIGKLFKNTEKAVDLNTRIVEASRLLGEVADLEEHVYNDLSEHV